MLKKFLLKEVPAVPLGVVFCCAAVLAVNLYFRAYPVYFPQLKLQARFNIEQSVVLRSQDLVNKQFPDLSPAARGTLVEAAVRDYKKRNAGQIRKDLQDEYLKLKDPLQNAYGQTYLMELDCWEWARTVENVLKHGHQGTEMANGRSSDMLSIAPQGRDSSGSNLFFWSSAWAYRLACRFAVMPLHDFLFYLPLFYIILLTCVLFFVCYRHYGILAACISCLFVGMAPIFLPRSCAGWFDTDILNLLFPVSIVYTYLFAYEKTSFASRAVWVSAAAVLVGLFALTWSWWWFICAVIFFYECFKLIDLVSEHIQYKEDVRACVLNHVFCLGFFTLFAAACVLLMSGSRVFIELASQVGKTFHLNEALGASIWPNVYSTVGELRKPDFIGLVRMVGGFILFFASTAAMLFLIVRNRGFRGLKRESLFLMVIWFMGSLLASFKGVRLTLFLLIPLAVPLGWAVQDLLDMALKTRQKPFFGMVCAFVGVLVFVMVNNGRLAARDMYPLIDDSWYSVLQTIKGHTPRQAIVNSWWDYGDWFKAIAERRVIFDGQSQNLPQSYWMAKALLAPSEAQAVRLLRMLNNGGNKAFELIDARLHDPLRSVLLLEKLLTLDRQKARVVLSDFLDDGHLQEVLKVLFDEPAPAFFIVDESMIGKIQPISFIGNWDFTKMYVAKNIRHEKEQVVAALGQLGVDPKRAALLYQDAALLPEQAVNDWISRPLRFYSGLIGGQEKSGRIFFNNGMVFDPVARTVECFDVGAGMYKKPKGVFFFENNRLVSSQTSDKPELPLSIAVLKNAKGYQSLVLDDQLVDSLFTRLFFLRGEGLSHFRLFSEKETGGRVIRVFEIVWSESP